MSLINLLKQIPKKVYIYMIAAIAFILTVIILTPIVTHHIELTKIKNQIEKTQLLIELNQQQRETCHNNMQLWHDENEANREILNNLMLQYNEMVGFTTA